MQDSIDAVEQGHDVVMTPNSFVYLDYNQGPKRKESLGIGGFLPLKTVYSFNPIAKNLDAKETKHILAPRLIY